MVRLLAAPGALEYEIGMLISRRAASHARRLLDDRERPDDGADLYSRAVRACYRTLQRQVMAQSRRALDEVRNDAGR